MSACVASSKHSRWWAKIAVASTAIGLSRKTGTWGIGAGLHEPAEVVEEFLGPLDGEHGNHHVAAVGHRAADHVGQLRFGVFAADVIAVAVGRFHDDEVGLGKDGGVAEDRLVPLPEVAGKEEPPPRARGSAAAVRTSIWTIAEPRMWPASWKLTCMLPSIGAGWP